ncbi:U1 small nuclear ribonucleoprotein [Encephalitozoon romaleae SJ-2008]|uniref:U1 small nuclear ribonucleoprotein n=1 Tax=Encephalitozoon romaleae (strain SJ-2008) TaxID=1178016 RepID=I7AM02_ENCRO|nr:U1 small nuclear ribonucleoprotein [Encephalitozoon romaleae SJ-2008]AFN82684.1 U1 small nuclear ribonucleoprotein [Encephalitozoon romaleae SJ-2008]
MGEGHSSRTLYIRNLNRKLPIREVKRRLALLVTRFSKILKIKMSNKPRLLGQAFVYLDGEVTNEILSNLNGRFFLGNVISVCPAHSDMCIGKRRAFVPTKTLLVTDIPSLVTRDDIEDIFKSFEGLENIRFIKVKSLAFVDFLSSQKASIAYSHFADGQIRHIHGDMKVMPSA